MTEVMKNEIQPLINMIFQHLEEQWALAESDEDEEVTTAVMNTFKAILAKILEARSRPTIGRIGRSSVGNWSNGRDLGLRTRLGMLNTLKEARLDNRTHCYSVEGMVHSGKEEQLPWFRQTRLDPGDPSRFLQTVRSLRSSLNCQPVSMSAVPLLI
jgi:hypothetical protein